LLPLLKLQEWLSTHCQFTYHQSSDEPIAEKQHWVAHNNKSPLHSHSVF
jgi:hypothetical protein